MGDREVKTAGPAVGLTMSADRNQISTDGKDLSYVTVKVTDAKGLVVPQANNTIHFEISGPGEIVATDNGDATDLTSFPSRDRKAFNGLALVVVRSKPDEHGTITLEAKSDSLAEGKVNIRSH